MKPLHFLFIEDDELTNQLMMSMLNSLGLSHYFHFKNNGYEALHFLRECEIHHEFFPEIVFVDIKMPIIDGFEFVSIFEDEFFRQHPKTKVFFLSSSTRQSDAENAFSFKCVTDYFPKPLTLEVFYKVLNDAEAASIKVVTK
jgi:CheY-like chemotaxis protein